MQPQPQYAAPQPGGAPQPQYAAPAPAPAPGYGAPPPPGPPLATPLMAGAPPGTDIRGHPEMLQLLNPANPNTQRMLLSQRRKGWFQECLGCTAKTEFDYYDGNNVKVAQSVDESDCCARTFCSACYSWETNVRSLQTSEPMITVKHPFTCATGACKCCAYQNVQVYSGNEHVGDVTEDCYWCVPRFTINDAKAGPIFKMHEPTCLGGLCRNVCAAGCCNCKRPFHIFPHAQEDTDGDVTPISVIMKDEKSLVDALISDADNFFVTFPQGCSAQQRALLIGAALLINFSFFENKQDQNSG